MRTDLLDDWYAEVVENCPEVRDERTGEFGEKKIPHLFVCLNKMDLADGEEVIGVSREKLSEFLDYAKAEKLYEVSAMSGKGVPEMITDIALRVYNDA